MNCAIVVKKLKELVKTDIIQVPEYIADIIKDNPNDYYILLCEYIVKRHKSLIKDMDNALKNYIKERQKVHDLISEILDTNVVSFTTSLNIIYYLNKDIKALSIFNTRLMALLDTLNDMNKGDN
jgi:hypothetical protein